MFILFLHTLDENLVSLLLQQLVQQENFPNLHFLKKALKGCSSCHFSAHTYASHEGRIHLIAVIMRA